MHSRFRLFAAVTLLSLARCASYPRGPEGARETEVVVSPADLVASIADVAAGRNAAMAEAGLVLKTIEFKLAVTWEEKTEGKVGILVLDLGGSRRSEVSFLQTFTLEIPREARKSVAAPQIPGVARFVEAAMTMARDLARAASRQGLPHKIREVELVAKIVRSAEAKGGIAFSLPTAVAPSVRAGGASASQEANTLRLIFTAP
jgi:hypothetical protein